MAKSKEDTWFIENPFKDLLKNTTKSTAKLEAASLLMKAIKMASKLMEEE